MSVLAEEGRGSANAPRHPLRDNGLLLASLGLFAVFFAGMVVSGTLVYQEEQHTHGVPQAVSILDYLRTGAFIEAMFENWESEFLQMGMYVVLTAYLYQRGSSESKPMNKRAPQDDDPRLATITDSTPWPVRRGGWVLRLYENSLALAFFVLFFASWALHAVGGTAAYNEEQTQHGEATMSVWQYNHHIAVLVRVDAELAERVHRGGRHRRSLHLPAPARVGGVQTGGRRAPGHQRLSDLTR